jgi:hypothetical protein
MLAEPVETGIVEHICLASDEVNIDRNVGGTRIGPAFKVSSRFRGSISELGVLEGHRLAIRTLRSRGQELRYVLDLRFVDSHPVIRRHLAIPFWLAALGCLAIAAAVHAVAGLQAVEPLDVFALPLEIGLGALAMGIACLGARRMHEVAHLQSVHGRIVLVEVVSNLGGFREFGSFAAEISRRIAAARAQVAQSRQQFLRDELREHRRLYEDGVLSRETYEAGKERILQAHD